jgi:tRNA-splicing ligase RtcB
MTRQKELMIVIPGNCVDSAYAVIGQEGLSQTHKTINHGCGRKYTRSQLFSRFRRADLSETFKGIVLNVSPSQMTEEHPSGYKNIEDVIDSLERFKIARRIAKLNPVAVIVDRGVKHARK